MTKIHDFHKPEKIKLLTPALVNELIKKHEGSKGILAVKEKEKLTFSGINNQVVLERSIQFYSKANAELYWFYLKELQDA